MEATVREIAAVLRSTEPMADRFVRRVQERMGQPVPHAEILSIMEKIPSKSLTMGKVVTKIKREQEKREEKKRRERRRKKR
jgi:hypothetical protein